MDWRHLFKSHILDRGLSYYESGSVEEYSAGKDFVDATVQGSDAYEVHVDLMDGDICDMQCDCPYAEDGNHCKHMAAVLFYMEREQAIAAERQKIPIQGAGKETARKTESDVKELVRNADETTVRNFLAEILEDDEELLVQFKGLICCKITAADIKRCQTRINKVFRSHARQGYIDYYSADSLVSELGEILDSNIGALLVGRQYTDAFELVNYVLAKVDEQEIDDSGGSLGILANQCAEIWQEILDHSDLGLTRRIYGWLKGQLDGVAAYYLEETVELLFFDAFHEDEFLTDKLAFTEEKVCAYKKAPASWSRGYNAGNWALSHIAVMEELNTPQDRLDAYAKENLEFNAVRTYYIQSCLNRKQYDAAIQALEEGKTADSDAPGLVAQYSLQLKDLYHQLGRTQDYIQELWLLILQYEPGDLSIYRELKALYPAEEWLKKREVVFQKLPARTAAPLYEEEQLYDRLLTFALTSNGLHTLQAYERCLKKLYPEELLTKYEAEITRMADYASDRKHYHELAQLLKQMCSYPGGKDRADNIVRDWKLKYRRRSAMMDELNKL